MQTMKTKELIPHPRNSYFFDDIAGEAWTEFLGSVKSSGIIEPIIVTQNKVIVSGHQRRRAALELGIEEVVVETKIFDSEDDVMKALIETNIRQRGAGNPNPVKFGRCLKELERIEGIRSGSANLLGENRIGDQNILGHQKTQTDLAEELGISDQTIRNYKALADATPTLQEIVEAGKITPTSALKIIRSMPEEEQEAIAKEIAKAEEPRVTPGQIAELEQRLKKAEAERDEAKAAKPEVVEKVVEKVVEVVPDDYETVKKKAKEAKAWETDYYKQRDVADARARQVQELQEKLEKAREETAKEQHGQSITASAIFYAAECAKFLESVGGYVWIADHLKELPERERRGYVVATEQVSAWAQALLQNMEDRKELPNG